MNIFDYLKGPHPWLDTSLYTPVQIALFLSGAVLWILVYIDTIRDILHKKTLNIPLIAICFNFGYEITTSFTFVPNMGKALVMAYWAWMVLDIFIFVSAFRYGSRQIRNSYFARNLSGFLLLGLAVGFFTQYFFIHAYDLPMAPLAGYIINLIMSACFLYLVFIPGFQGNSLLTAWGKFLGTGMISIMFQLKYPQNHFLSSLYIFTAVFDIIYIYLLYQKNLIPHEGAANPT